MMRPVSSLVRSLQQPLSFLNLADYHRHSSGNTSDRGRRRGRRAGVDQVPPIGAR